MLFDRNRKDLEKIWSHIFQDSQYLFCKKDPQMHPYQCLSLCSCVPEIALYHTYSLSITVALNPRLLLISCVHYVMCSLC